MGKLFSMISRRLRPSIRIVLGMAMAAAALMTVSPARAQFGNSGSAGSASWSTLLSSIYGTNSWTNTQVVASSSTNFVLPNCGTNTATTSSLDAYNINNLSLELAQWPSTAGATGAVYFVRSVDGCNWETTPAFVLYSASTSAGVSNIVCTNVLLGAYRYICPSTWTNLGGMSNIVLKYSIKPGL